MLLILVRVFVRLISKKRVLLGVEDGRGGSSGNGSGGGKVVDMDQLRGGSRALVGVEAGDNHVLAIINKLLELPLICL